MEFIIALILAQFYKKKLINKKKVVRDSQGYFLVSYYDDLRV